MQVRLCKGFPGGEQVAVPVHMQVVELSDHLDSHKMDEAVNVP